MRIIFYFLCFVVAINVSFAQQFSVLTWNIANLGKSKSELSLKTIAEVIEPADIICLQEVVAGYGGAQAVAKIVDYLNRKANIWDYSISNPTQSSTNHHSERYAFIWKKNKVKIKRKFELESIFKNEIEREPYIGSFTINNTEFKIFNFHAVPKKNTPEKEIKYFKEYTRIYGNNLIFLGDFNVTNTNTVFNPIYKQGFKNAFSNQKTTLKQVCKNNNCLANAYDHVLYPTQSLKVIKAEPILFYTAFENVKQARKISDHIPLFVTFQIL